MRFTALCDKHNPWAGDTSSWCLQSLWTPPGVADSRKRHMDYRLPWYHPEGKEAKAAQGWMLFGFHLSVSPGKRGDDRSIPFAEHKSKRCYRESDWRVISSVLRICFHFWRTEVLQAIGTAAYQAPPSMDFPGKSTRVGCHCLLQMVIIASPYWRLTLSQTLVSNVFLIVHPQKNILSICEIEILIVISTYYRRMSFRWHEVTYPRWGRVEMWI